jgi:hypothetical protein
MTFTENIVVAVFLLLVVYHLAAAIVKAVSRILPDRNQ